MRTTVQRVSMIFGAVFLLVALMGFIAAGTSMEADPGEAPRVLDLFPVNLLHNLVHLAFGVWGVVAARRWDSARAYCRIAGILYLVLAVLGFLAPNGFGLVPLGGHDIWLHVVLGAALTVVGFTAAAENRAPGAAPFSRG